MKIDCVSLTFSLCTGSCVSHLTKLTHIDINKRYMNHKDVPLLQTVCHLIHTQTLHSRAGGVL